MKLDKDPPKALWAEPPKPSSELEAKRAALSLPKKISAYLDSKYPGWAVARIHPSLESCIEPTSGPYPTVAVGGFSGAGRQEYALEIAHRGKLLLLGFVGGSVQSIASFPYEDGHPIALKPSQTGVEVGVKPGQRAAGFEVLFDCDKSPDRYIYGPNGFNALPRTD